MEAFAIYWLGAIFSLSNSAGDPVMQGWKGRDEARQLDCERLSQAEAHERFPAEVPATALRSAALMDIDALVCRRRLLRYGERDDRDELVLSQLGVEVAGLTQQAMALAAPQTRWFVDAFYPQPQVAQKIANAARLSLAEAGQHVSSQAPLLAAADVAILRELTLADALPLACQRLSAEKTLGDHDAFLGVALVRPQETQLHAGVCLQGGWRWLR